MKWSSDGSISILSQSLSMGAFCSVEHKNQISRRAAQMNNMMSERKQDVFLPTVTHYFLGTRTSTLFLIWSISVLFFFYRTYLPWPSNPTEGGRSWRSTNSTSALRKLLFSGFLSSSLTFSFVSLCLASTAERSSATSRCSLSSCRSPELTPMPSAVMQPSHLR